MRVQVSILLVGFATLALVIPDRHHSAMELKPREMIGLLGDTANFMSPDQVARAVVSEDTSILLVDLRDHGQYMTAHIPGAVNIPFEDLLNPDWSGYLYNPPVRAILYSNGDALASEAWALCMQKGYTGTGIMKGGMNGWYRTVMESEFTGNRITAAENALYETRYRAREFFNTMNSLPDSLKNVFLDAKKKKEAELVGGCE